MTFDNLVSQYGEAYVLDSDARKNVISERLILACQDLLSRNLKAGGKTFNFAGAHDFEDSIVKLYNKFDSNDVVGVAATLSHIFQARKETVEQLTYSVNPSQFQNIEVLSAIGTYKGNKNLYDRLTDFNSVSRPITTTGTYIKLNFKKIKNRCEDFIKDFEINVQGKRVVGEEFEEDILMHGNQVLATETSPEGITYKVEKSGDLPSDQFLREEIMSDRIYELDDMVSSGEVIKYEINSFSNRTIIKTYFKVLEDYENTFNVGEIL